MLHLLGQLVAGFALALFIYWLGILTGFVIKISQEHDAEGEDL